MIFKIKKILTIIFLISALFAPYKTQASNIPTPYNNSYNTEETTQGIHQVVIIFGTYVVGWVIDGVITYSTGHAPSEWVRLGLNKIENDIKNLNYTVSVSGTHSGNYQIHITYSGRAYLKCIKYPCIVDY